LQQGGATKKIKRKNDVHLRQLAKKVRTHALCVFLVRFWAFLGRGSSKTREKIVHVPKKTPLPQTPPNCPTKPRLLSVLPRRAPGQNPTELPLGAPASLDSPVPRAPPNYLERSDRKKNRREKNQCIYLAKNRGRFRRAIYCPFIAFLSSPYRGKQGRGRKS
jgi:hypothetical protein